MRKNYEVLGLPHDVMTRAECEGRFPRFRLLENELGVFQKGTTSCGSVVVCATSYDFDCLYYIFDHMGRVVCTPLYGSVCLF